MPEPKTRRIICPYCFEEMRDNETRDQHMCSHCHSALPTDYGRHDVKFVAVVGSSGVGKTAFLSQLFSHMAEHATHVGLTAVAIDQSITTFCEHNMVQAGKALPNSTSLKASLQPLFYELSNNSQTITLVFYDVSGEVFEEARLINRFTPFLSYADGLIMLVDPLQLQTIAGVSDNPLHQNPTHTLHSVYQVLMGTNTDAQCTVPIALCLSKVDLEQVRHVLPSNLYDQLLADEVDTPQSSGDAHTPVFDARGHESIARALYEWIETNEPLLARSIESNFSTFDCFGFTSLGCSVVPDAAGRMLLNKPAVPKRIEEPVIWLLHQFGILGANAISRRPSDPIVACPSCGGEDALELPEHERQIITGWGPFKKATHVNYQCLSCGYHWFYS